MPTAPGFLHEDSHSDEILAHYFRIRDKKVTVVENGTALSLKLELNALPRELCRQRTTPMKTVSSNPAWNSFFFFHQQWNLNVRCYLVAILGSGRKQILHIIFSIRLWTDQLKAMRSDELVDCIEWQTRDWEIWVRFPSRKKNDLNKLDVMKGFGL